MSGDSSIWNTLNNGSVAAFLGAFFAYVLVQFNDFRRERRKIKLLKEVFTMALESINTMQDSIATQYKSITKNGILRPGKIMDLNASAAERLLSECSIGMQPSEKQAARSICFVMDGINTLLEESHAIAMMLRRFSFMGGENVHVRGAVEQLISDYIDALSSLERLRFCITAFLGGQANKVLDTQVNRLEFLRVAAEKTGINAEEILNRERHEI